MVAPFTSPFASTHLFRFATPYKYVPILTYKELVSYTALKIDRVVSTHIGEDLKKLNIILHTCQIYLELVFSF